MPSISSLRFLVISTGGRNLSFFPVTIMTVENHYYVYLMTNWNHRVIYLGVTNDLTRRVYEHKNKLVKGFTEKYNINKLVYFEETADVLSAIAREKEIKKWRREKKDSLVPKRKSEVAGSIGRGERFLASLEMTRLVSWRFMRG